MKRAAMHRKPAAPAVEYPAGYFAAVVHMPSTHNPGGWPPRWSPRYQPDARSNQSAISTESRERLIERTGSTGTILGLSKASDKRTPAQAAQLLAHRTRG